MVSDMGSICIFNGDMSRGGGTERITQILANALAEEAQFHVIVLNLNNDAGTSFYPLIDAVEFLTLRQQGIRKKVMELRRLLCEKQVDVLIDVDIMLAIYALPATFLHPKTKLISWEMFNLRNDIGSRHTAMMRKLCLRRSAYYVNQTKGDMEAFQKEMPVKCPITHIYNPCEIDTTYTDYDEASKTIVTAGHFFYTKGYDLAVEVAKIVFARHPDWRWEFYGDGKEMKKIAAQVQAAGLERQVIFCGRSNNITAVYKKAAMYVMTSRTEGFGLVLTEAKACNLPTLAYDIDFGPREIIEDGVSGYLVPAFDAQKMADRICTLIENPALRKQFSMHSKDNCEKFTQSAFVERWLGVLSEVEKR